MTTPRLQFQNVASASARAAHLTKSWSQLARDIIAHVDIKLEERGSVDKEPFKNIQLRPGKTIANALVMRDKDVYSKIFAVLQRHSDDEQSGDRSNTQIGRTTGKSKRNRYLIATGDVSDSTRVSRSVPRWRSCSPKVRRARLSNPAQPSRHLTTPTRHRRHGCAAKSCRTRFRTITPPKPRPGSV